MLPRKELGGRSLSRIEYDRFKGKEIQHPVQRSNSFPKPANPLPHPSN